MASPLFELLEDATRQELLRAARRRRFGRNEVVFHEGDPGDSLHVIERGKVAVRVSTPLGDVATVNILRAGDLFGELAVIAPAPRNATVVALEPTETLALHRDVFEALRRASPSIDRFLLESVVAEVRRLTVQLLEAMYVPVEKRVPRRLRDLTDAYADGAGADTPVVIPLTQDVIAQLAGTTRPTANRILRDLEKAGAIDVGRGRVTITDRATLERRAG